MVYTDLEPKKVFSYFKQISDIPRGSGNEAAAAKFVRDTALALGHSATIDGAGNVLVKAKATPGYESHEPVMLQGHLDMVCEANRGTVHDFTKDPIKLVLTGDELRADGTTLGADNGVAVAIMLAVLDENVPHPALECLFTTEEETGLSGMRGFDASTVISRRLINIDSAGEGEATVSCAGGVRSHIYFDFDKEILPENYTTCTLGIKGLFGGHSGEDIHLGRMGALSIGARILYSASKSADIRISALDGGSRDNAIPREFSAVCSVSDYVKFESAVQAEIEKIRSELVNDDSALEITLEKTAAESFISGERSGALIRLLRSLPHGVREMSRTVDGLVETSSNLAVVRKSERGCEIVVSSRSSVSSKLDAMEDLVEAIAVQSGATVEHTGRYPGWDHTEGSAMQRLYLESCREVFGREGKIIGIHAGLECGLLKSKLNDMDMISIGPDIKNLHSPDEVLSVSSLSRLWELICNMLEKM